MALKIDTARPLLRDSQLRELVAAILAGDPNDEHDWVEWKSRLDLTQTRSQEHIAKHVLGFCNRTVQTAALHAGGHAYVLIGVEPGSITGAETIDPANLTNAIMRYVGTDGPQWNAEHVSVEGHTILVVIVDPPQHGDPPHTLRHRLANHEPGTVLVRRIGQTTQASPAEVAALVDRARATRNSLAVDVRPTCVTIEGALVDVECLLAEILAAERRLLMRPSRARRQAERPESNRASLWPRNPGQLPPAPQLWSSLMGPSYKPDDRSEADYEQEVDDYLAHLRDILLRRLLYRQLKHTGAALQLVVDNLTERNFAQLRVQVHLSGAVRRWPDDLKGDLVPLDGLPSRPPVLGTPVKVESVFDRLHTQGLYPHAMPSIGSSGLWSPGFTVRETGSVDIEYDPLHLHPSTPESLPVVPLLVDESVGTELVVTWSATAQNADMRVTGEFTIVVVESTLSFDTLPDE